MYMFSHIAAFRSIFVQHFTKRPFKPALNYIFFFSGHLLPCPTAEIQDEVVLVCPYFELNVKMETG